MANFESIYQSLVEDAGSELKFANSEKCLPEFKRESEAVAKGILYALHSVAIEFQAGTEILSEVRAMITPGN